MSKTLDAAAGAGKLGQRAGPVVAINDPVGNLVAVHRVFLTPDGRKAAIDTPKRTLGPEPEP